MRYSNIWYVFIPLYVLLILGVAIFCIYNAGHRNKKTYIILGVIAILLSGFEISNVINYSQEYKTTYEIYSINNEEKKSFSLQLLDKDGELYAHTKVFENGQYNYKNIYLGGTIHFRYNDSYTPSITVIYEAWKDYPTSYVLLPESNLEMTFKEG